MYSLKIVSDTINICLSDFLPINQFNGPDVILENNSMRMVDFPFFRISGIFRTYDFEYAK